FHSYHVDIVGAAARPTTVWKPTCRQVLPALPALTQHLTEASLTNTPHIQLGKPPDMPGTEPVPLPQILAKSLFVTADWCNVTLECTAVGASEDLNVIWWHSDLPRKWQQTGTLGPGPSTWPLAVRLPLDQANTSFTCIASNEVDLKTATSTLGDICAQGFTEAPWVRGSEWLTLNSHPRTKPGPAQLWGFPRPSAGQAGGRSMMGPCSEDPHLRWASWLLGLAELAGVLLGVCGTGPLSSGGADSRAHVSLKRVRGGSVLFHVTQEMEGDAEAQLEEMAWGFGPDTNYRVLLRVVSGGDLPTLISHQDKYRHRVHVPNMTSLLIENLTCEDSGQYRARASFTGGRGFTQVFQLTVYEPVPLPQILAKSLSVTADWCNVTLECRAVGASEDLNVTWWSSDLPRKWQQTGTLGPGSSIWALAVRLPLDQANTSLTCNAINQVDMKTATTTLGDICAHREYNVSVER
ncbi:PREDICTED: uncharacterized protein LOC109378150, partial [Hipposideros armiger]|uniref:Uncharacterized protein LOC109378150 n=1 Tax=Hipposideros armiger TaxID=186990 RepID=A0A8B7QNG4_HIPAR